MTELKEKIIEYLNDSDPVGGTREVDCCKIAEEILKSVYEDLKENYYFEAAYDDENGHDEWEVEKWAKDNGIIK